MAKFKENLYTFTIKLPDALLTLIQLLLVLRFISSVFIEATTNTPVITQLYRITDIIVFPIGVVVSLLVPPKGLLYESALLVTAVLYALLYTLTISIINKVLLKEKE